MTDIAPIDDPITTAALRLARLWCDGHRVGDDDALAHALRVVAVLQHHAPHASPEAIAAVLLHDSPDFAPPEVDLDAVLVTLTTPEVVRLVRAQQHEHDRLDSGETPEPSQGDLSLMLASAADKIVSLRGVLDRAKVNDPAVYWARRRGFATALPYFRAFHSTAEAVLPPAMAGELGALITRAEKLVGEATAAG